MEKKIKIIIGVVVAAVILIGGLIYVGSRAQIHPLCLDFEQLQERNRCQGAIDVALAKYVGEVQSIAKTEYEGSPGWKVEIKVKKGQELYPMMKINEKEPGTYIADEYEVYAAGSGVMDNGVSQKEVQQIAQYIFGDKTFVNLEIHKTEKDVSILGGEADIKDVWDVKVFFSEDQEIEFMNENIYIKGYGISLDYKTGGFLSYFPISSDRYKEEMEKFEQELN